MCCNRCSPKAHIDLIRGYGKFTADPQPTIEVHGKKYTAPHILIATGGHPAVPSDSEIPGEPDHIPWRGVCRSKAGRGRWDEGCDRGSALQVPAWGSPATASSSWRSCPGKAELTHPTAATADGSAVLHTPSPLLHRRSVIVGAGYIAVELAGILSALGSKSSLLIRQDKVHQRLSLAMPPTLSRIPAPAGW